MGGGRRWFLKNVLGTSALALLAACAPAPQATPTSPPAAKPPAPPAAPTSAPAAAPTTVAKPAAAPTSPPAQAAPAAPKTITLPKPEITRLTIGHSTLEPTQFPIKLALDLGLFRKHGFDDVELTFFDGAPKLISAMVGGHVDAGMSSATSAINTQETDAPMRAVAITASRVVDDFVAVSSVTSAADLKGKTVAVSGLGTESHGTVLLLLRSLGMTGDDVTVTGVGGEGARIAALQGGSVAAAHVDAARRSEMQALGFNILARLSDGNYELPRSGLVVPADWPEKQPNTGLALTAAVLEAQQIMYQDTPKAVEIFHNWTQSKDAAASQKRVEDYKAVARRDLSWTKSSWEDLRDVIASQNPNVKGLDVTKAYTFQFLDKLKEMGFSQSVGVE